MHRASIKYYKDQIEVASSKVRGKMKQTLYSDEQIVRILHETDTETVIEVAKCDSVNEATIYIETSRVDHRYRSPHPMIHSK